MMHQHLQEWKDSAVDPAIVALNCESLEDFEVQEFDQSASYPIAERLNWHVTRFGHQIRERSALRGWWVSGIDPLNDWGRMTWGRFKPDPDTPIIDQKKGEAAKYLSPKGEASRAIFLDVPLHIWESVSRRYGLEIGDSSSFWQWVWNHPQIPLILCEGEKKAGCLLSLGYVAIALPGITTGARSRDSQGRELAQPVLIPEISHFLAPGREFVVCFDYETKRKTLRAVARETNKLSWLIKVAGCNCSVIHLPGPEKGVDDFVIGQGAEAFALAYTGRKSPEEWLTDRLSRLDFPVSDRVNSRYLGELNYPDSAKLIGIKSAKGTGKTHSYESIVQAAHQNGQPVIMVGHRVQLVQATCNRVGLDYVTEIRSSDTARLLGYGLCIDSLHQESQARFNPEHWKNPIVIIDECEQVFWHLLEAKTEVKKHRIQILQNLLTLLENALESESGRVFVSDADLSNLSIEFIQNLCRNKVKPWVIQNDWQATDEGSWLVSHYNQNEPLQWFAALNREIESGGNVLIATHSQKAKSRWSTRTLETVLAARFPDKAILRIDSQSIADPGHPAYGCVSNLNEVLGKYNIVICSPSIETGVSIDIKGHFSSVWGCFQGVSPENSTRQALARLREPVPRHIWIAKRGIGAIGGGSTSYKQLILSQRQLAQANLTLSQAIASTDLEELNCSASALDCWAKLASRINAGMIRYRDAVLKGLQAEGHYLVDADLPSDPAELAELKSEIVATRNEQHARECLAIAEAEELTPKQFEELKGQKAKKIEEVYQERKFILQERYKVPVTPELVGKDDEGLYPKWRLFYFLSLGRDFLSDRDKQTAEGEIKNGKAWFPTFNRSQLGAAIATLELMGLTRLLNPGKLYSKQSRTVLEIAEFALRYRREIKDTLNVTVNAKQTPIQIAQTLLSRLGLKLQYQGRLYVLPSDDRFDCGEDDGNGDGPTRERCYSFAEVDDGREAIYRAWFDHDLARLEAAMSTPSIEDKEIDGEAAA